MTDPNPLVIAYILLYPVGLAGLLHLAHRSGRFERRHLLTATLLIGFLLGIGGNLAFFYLVFGFDDFYLVTAGHTLVAGLLTAWRLFAIVYIWSIYAERLWITVPLAGLMAMESGPFGLQILAALVSQKEWMSFSWGLPFFILGLLTHILLRADVSPDQPGYYRFSPARLFLVVLLVPVMALLSWCASLLTTGAMIIP